MAADTLIGGDRFYKTAFFVLVSFLLGNGVNFLIFGLHTASKSDLQAQSQVQTQQYDAIEASLSGVEAHLSAIDNSYADLTGQLRAKKLIDAK